VIQKKVCMVGMFGVGKTCLVQQYVHSIFSAKYHSTVGVKIDRKVVPLGDREVTLILWDLAGRDGVEDITTSYLRGAHAILYVVDGTRRETYDQVFDLREVARSAAGDIPSAVALNKTDLTDEWRLSERDEQALADQGWHAFRTSAKSGDGVESAFLWLAGQAVASGGQTT
jgi:small GTP-binding protein